MRISDWSSDVCPSDLLQLQPPAATPAAQSDEFTLDAKAAARLKAVAREFAGSFLAFDVHNPEFERSVRQITTIGSEEVRKLSEQARLTLSRSSMRDRAVAAVNAQPARLRLVLDRLAPGEDIPKPKKFLGLFARYNPILTNSDPYLSSQAEIKDTLHPIRESPPMLFRGQFATYHTN